MTEDSLDRLARAAEEDENLSPRAKAFILGFITASRTSEKTEEP